MDLENDVGFSQFLQSQANPDKADANLAVRFYTDEMEDPAKSKEEGRPIFTTVECVEIRVPGDKDNIRRGPLRYFRPDPRERFPAAYAKFKARASTQYEGTPLRQWGVIASTRAKEYEYFGIHTVEQLASVSDANLQNVKGAMSDRQKAQDFLAVAKGQQPLAQARAEAEALKNELQTLKGIIEEQGAKIEKLTKKSKKASEED